MGFALLGVFAWNRLALQGVVLQMICHALSTGALFILVGGLQERMHTRELGRMGGLWETAPRMGAMAMFFAMASLGLPGLGNFVAEFLTLLGTWRVAPGVTVVAALGLVVAAIYSLWLVQKAFHGERDPGTRIPDLSVREVAVLGAMVVGLVWLGLYPQTVVETANPALDLLEPLLR
jgi:NADH-quinone oxidoreductase subunit M